MEMFSVLLALQAKVHLVSLRGAIGFQPGVARVAQDHHGITVGGGKIRNAEACDILTNEGGAQILVLEGSPGY